MLDWIVFALVVTALLALDLAVFHRHARRESLRAAVGWSVFWVGLGLAFGGFVWLTLGARAGLEYFTAFLIEKSLSVDNLFVFLALFTYFGVRREYQHRVLFWGIVGALATRGAFIFAGVALINTFHWLIYLLGVLLVATGARLALQDEEDQHPENNVVVRFASAHLPLTRRIEGEAFFLRRDGRWLATPLLLALIAIESTDVMFAVDSVPAVLAVTRDTFVVYSSNIFAILGLRALYFALAGAMLQLRLLRPALALILALIGAKMLVSEVVEVPTWASLAGVGGILAGATVLSLVLGRRGKGGEV